MGELKIISTQDNTNSSNKEGSYGAYVVGLFFGYLTGTVIIYLYKSSL